MVSSGLLRMEQGLQTGFLLIVAISVGRCVSDAETRSDNLQAEGAKHRHDVDALAECWFLRGRKRY